MKYKNEDKKERRKVENPQNHMGVDLAGIRRRRGMGRGDPSLAA